MEVHDGIFVVVAHTVGGSCERQRVDMNAVEHTKNITGRIEFQCKASAAAVCHTRGRLSTITRVHFSADRSNS